MTPDEARALLDGTTPGQWGHYLPRGKDGHYDPVFGDVPGDEISLVKRPADWHLIAAAPALAAMIAGMREEYQAEYQAADGRWFPVPHYCSCGRGWGTKQRAEFGAADWKDDGYATRIVRRYVTTPEEA